MMPSRSCGGSASPPCPRSAEPALQKQTDRRGTKPCDHEPQRQGAGVYLIRPFRVYARLGVERRSQRAEQEQPAGAENDPRRHAGLVDEEDHDRCDEADQRCACEQTQPCELAVDGLAAQLEAKRFLRAPPLFFHLRALELEPRMVAIERFLERRDDDVGQPRFDFTGESLRRRRLRQRRFGWWRRGRKTLEP